MYDKIRGVLLIFLSFSFLFISFSNGIVKAENNGNWVSSGYSEDVINVAEFNNGTRKKNVDFNTIKWQDVSKVGLMLPRENNKSYSPTCGFETNYGSLLLYPLGYNKAPVHLFLKLHIKKGINWYEKFITSLATTKIPRYTEQVIEGIEKELGYYETITELGYNFSVYLGIKANQFSENFQIKTNITTPLDIDNIAIEYIFALNPNLVEQAKKVKWIRTYRKHYNETTGYLINITKIDYELNQFIDNSGILPDFVKTIEFVTENDKEIQLFNFEDVWNMSKTTFWKIEQIELPNMQTTYVLHIGSTFGNLSANEKLIIDPSWVSPTGFSDPTTKWLDETKAYDENTGTYAYAIGIDTVCEWTEFVYYIISPNITSNKLRFHVQTTYQKIQTIDIDVLLDDSWTHAYQGDFAENTWVNISHTQGIVEQMRLRFHMDEWFYGIPDIAKINELDFLEIEEVAEWYHIISWTCSLFTKEWFNVTKFTATLFTKAWTYCVHWFTYLLFNYEYYIILLASLFFMISLFCLFFVMTERRKKEKE